MIRRAELKVGRWARSHLRALIVATVLILLSAVALWVVPTLLGVQDRADRQQRQSNDQRKQISGLSKALDAQRDQVKKLGATPVAPPADKVRANPTAPIPSPSTSVVGPSDAQVYAAVADYFKSHPVGPTPADIAAAVVNYLTAHPAPAGPKGDAGAAPTADQLATAVANFCGQDSAPCRGPAGEKGDTGATGPGPTADQLADAVRSYVQANPLPTCPDGTTATAETVLTTSGPVDAVICVRNG